MPTLWVVLGLVVGLCVVVWGVVRAVRARRRRQRQQTRRPRHVPLIRPGRPDKLVWTYWNDENLPLTVRLCVASWHHCHPDWTVTVVTPKTLHRFLDPGAFPPIFATLSHTFQSDVIRILLLEQYGGVWMDSSILMQRPVLEEWVAPPSYDVGGYYMQAFTAHPDYKSVEVWFIAAPKDSRFVRAWKEEFFRALAYPSRSHYIEQLVREGLPLSKNPFKEYLMFTCCFLKVLQDHPGQFRLRQLEATDAQQGPLFYVSSRGWDSRQAVRSLHTLASSDTPTQPLLKMRVNERTECEAMIHTAHPQSVVGRVQQAVGFYT